MKFVRHSFLAVLAVSMFGCGPQITEQHRKLNDLNFDAGAQIATHSDPVVAQVGRDVKANSEVLSSTLLGWPVDRVKYDAVLSAKVREEALKEYENNQPWYKKFFGYFVSGLGVLGTLGMLAARFFPATAPIVAIAEPIIATLMSIKQKADAHPSDSLHIDDIQREISGLASDPKAGPIVTSLLKKLHVEQLIHSPEAADPAVS